jgi:hypothetical protein
MIKQLSIEKGQLILDPFCGTGTTLVQATKRGIHSIGIDASPFSCFVSRVKTNRLLDAEKILDCFPDIEVGNDVLTRGTRILADDVTPTFTQAFLNSLTLEEFKPIPAEWKNAVTRILSKSHSLQLLGDYWRLLWELSAACPIPYLADDAVPGGLIKDFQASLERYKFSLFADGRQLFKPVFLKKNPGGYTTKSIPSVEKKIYGRTLKFSGYIVVQEGMQIKPDELRGKPCCRAKTCRGDSSHCLQRGRWSLPPDVLYQAELQVRAAVPAHLTGPERAGRMMSATSWLPAPVVTKRK